MKNVIGILKRSMLFRDSFWALTGNGLGYGLLFVAGILIARFLGKDVYGEYGLVKTTMFYAAAFSTFGLGYTSTKFVAEYRCSDTSHVRSIIKSSMRITFASSTLLALLLLAFAVPLSKYLGSPQLVMPLRLLAGIIVCQAINTTQQGILAGLGAFRNLGINNVFSGMIMLILCVPLTFFGGLLGSLFALLVSQFAFACFNMLTILHKRHDFPICEGLHYDKTLLKFSFPVAIQEFSYTLSNWGCSLLLVKYASMGDMGIYAASSQWNGIILFIPGLLSNVALSHLSNSLDNRERHRRTIRTMLLVNLGCTLLPFLLVWSCSAWISSFYGPTFSGMTKVLQILVFSTIFGCLSKVLQVELISQGTTWFLFIIRFSRDATLFLMLYFFLTEDSPFSGAMGFAVASLVSAITYFTMLGIYYYFVIEKKTT